MAEIPNFQYKPLSRFKDIRLVILKHGSSDEPIHCKLVEVRFSQDIRYEALSYEWGSRLKHKQPIYVNGVPRTIRKNLYDALLHLRRSRWDRYLWIDALCINQEDVKEKNHQLPLMGPIYGRAWDVLAWLGLTSDDSHLAICHLIKLGLDGHEASLKALNNEQQPLAKELDSIVALCKRSYWHRIWVVQEIRLASHITYHCGGDTMAGETFALALKFISLASNSKTSSLLFDIQKSMASKIVDYSIRPKELRLKEWLIKTQDSLATDPKDKVYALLNLATDCRDNPRLRADYSKSKTPSEVYKDVMLVCSTDKATRQPCNDTFDLSQVLQRALNIHPITVQLSPSDTQPIWICGIFSAQITSFDRPPKPILKHTLYPKNIFEGHDFTWYNNAFDCILAADTGKSIRFINQRRHSDPSAPVQMVDDITIALTSPIETFRNPWTIEVKSEAGLKSRLKNPQDCGKPFTCIGQGCTGFAPTDSKMGDKICRFPGSRVGLVFRRVEAASPASNEGSKDYEFKDNQPKDGWTLVGRAIMDERFQISEKETESFWRGDPGDLSSVSFGSENGWYLRLGMVTLQRLTAE